MIAENDVVEDNAGACNEVDADDNDNIAEGGKYETE